MTKDWLQDINTGQAFYPITHEDAVIDNNGTTLSSKLSNLQALNDGEELLKNEPDSYLKNVQYNIENNNVSHIQDYISSDIIATRTDQPLPVLLNSEIQGNIYVTPTYNKVAKYTSTENGYYNLIPGSRYFFQDSSNNQHSFTVKGKRRFIWADNVLNVRDLGGIPTKANGHIAYDKIIRGSEVDGATVTATNTAIAALSALDFTLELDLRRSDELSVSNQSSSQFATEYKRISFLMFQNIQTLDDDEKAKIKEAFETVANEIIEGGKVYIHCVWGYHRAGFLSTLIEGILGATQYEIDKDYELSSFSSLGVLKRTDNNYKSGITAINEQYGGSWIRFAKACGISGELIDSFRKAMIVETKEESVNQYIEVTYQELRTLKDNAQLIPGAFYRMIDFDTWDGAEVNYAACSGISDLAEFRSAYHHFDLVLLALSTYELDSNVKAIHSDRDTENYFKDDDLAKWELRYDLDNNVNRYSWAVNHDIIAGSRTVTINSSRPVDAYLFENDFADGTISFTIPNLGLAFRIQGDSISKYLVLEQNNPSVWIPFSTEQEPPKVGDRLEYTLLSDQLNIYSSYYYCDPSPYYHDILVYEDHIIYDYRHTEGKGVIYYMKDENNNELPYDFKNILFKYNGNWIPTFSNVTYNIIIKPYIDSLGQHLNKNIFVNSGYVKECEFNFNTHDNTIIGKAINLVVGKYSSNNTFANSENVVIDCDNFNQELYDLTNSSFGLGCYNNIIYGQGNSVIAEDYISNQIGGTNSSYTKLPNNIQYSTTLSQPKAIGYYSDGSTKCAFGSGEYSSRDLPKDNLVNVTLSTNVTSIGHYAFQACSNLTSITIPDSVTSIGGSVFYGCQSLTSITIPSSVTSIGPQTFQRCSSLTSVIIPNSVISIGEQLFEGCDYLTSVILGSGITSISQHAFYTCSRLNQITIPENINSIGPYAFSYCYNLTSINLPENITSIGEGAFIYCRQLQDVYSFRLTPITISSDTFANISANATLHVPQYSLIAYSNTAPWSLFPNIVAI